MKRTLFEELFNQRSEYHAHASVKDNGDVYIATLELAGFSKDDVKISVTNDLLTVEAEKESKRKHCSLRLKDLVATASITSKIKDGLLEITLPKKEVSDTINIEIN